MYKRKKRNRYHFGVTIDSANRKWKELKYFKLEIKYKAKHDLEAPQRWSVFSWVVTTHFLEIENTKSKNEREKREKTKRS